MKFYVTIRIALFTIFLMNYMFSFAQITEEYSFTTTEKESYFELKERIEEYEKQVLKQKIQSINKQLDLGEVSETDAKKLKAEAAEIAAKNISDLNEVVDAYTTYVKRNYEDFEIDFSNLDFSDLDFNLPFSGLEKLAETLQVLGDFFQTIKDEINTENADLTEKRKEVKQRQEALQQAKEELKQLRENESNTRNTEIETPPTPLTPPSPLSPEKPEAPEAINFSELKGSRSTGALVLAVGFNNMLSSESSLDNSGIRFGGSRSFEIGYARESRVFKNMGWLSVKYGFSFQFNGLKPEGNNVFAVNGDQTHIEEFDFNLRKNKFRMDNLIFPLHLQLGSNGIKTNSKGARYYSDHDFKVGLGGFLGLNLLNTNKLKYTNDDGQRIKERIRDDFNTTNLLYGLSAYIGWDDFSFYAQYNLNPMFTDNIVDTHNIQFGVRFDFN